MSRKEASYQVINDFFIAIKCWYSSSITVPSTKSNNFC